MTAGRTAPTVEMADGKRVELRVPGTAFGQPAKRDRGRLTQQVSRVCGVHRSR